MMQRLGLITFDVTNTLMHLKNSTGFEYLKIAEIYCNQIVVKSNKSRNECENQLSNAFKTVWKDMNRDYPNYGLNDNMSSVEWWSQNVKKTFRLAQFSDKHINDKQLDSISKHLFKHYSSANCWTTDRNSHNVLSRLKKLDPNLKIGVISNFDERLDHILHEIGFRHYFDFVIMSRSANCWKPSKQIFDLSLKSAQMVDPSKALHIGDDLNLDYLSAKSFGWNALLYTNNRRLSESELTQINRKDIICDLIQLIDH